jgi:putative ATP-dependent endonuclease of the OLD family
MKVISIKVENFRPLKSFSLDLEKDLSLVIGKNNTGKTSILNILDKFLNLSDSAKFTFDDFNIEFKKSLIDVVEERAEIPESNYKDLGIRLRILIEYERSDDLSNISRLMMDLDPDNNMIVLGFDFILDYFYYQKIRYDYNLFEAVENQKAVITPMYTPKRLGEFISLNIDDYFKLIKKSIKFDMVSKQMVETNFLDLKSADISIKDIINFKFISAKRDVTNKVIDKTLSRQTSRIYQRSEADEEQLKAVEEFKDTLSTTDKSLTHIYKDMFKEIVANVRLFGGITANESEIAIISTLQQRELLEGNTTVVYQQDTDHRLPEHYNGLGYMNLISIIFEIEILVQEFKREKEKRPSDINLLFIEEPEAHTHPQMQYVFIKNIKKLLSKGVIRSDGLNRKLQYVISTHSSHIVADSDFNDIKYLKKDGVNRVISKNVRDLEKEYVRDGQEKNFRFLKQYLTLNRAELFFADKAVFIEGDTERILLPAMMRKLDTEYAGNPLLSQNISIVEVGAHSHIFEKFIDFVGIKKALIITDIDSFYLVPDLEDDGVTQKRYANGNLKFKIKQCPANDVNANKTGNYSLKFFHRDRDELAYFKTLPASWKILRKKNKIWVSNRRGPLMVVFQTEEATFHGRSFEDSFFNANSDFIADPAYQFPSITTKYLEEFRRDKECFKLAEMGVGSKPSLAIEILLNSVTDAQGVEFSNWQIPNYIKEGLLWLKD